MFDSEETLMLVFDLREQFRNANAVVQNARLHLGRIADKVLFNAADDTPSNYSGPAAYVLACDV
jgi:hypothetical protein